MLRDIFAVMDEIECDQIIRALEVQEPIDRYYDSGDDSQYYGEVYQIGDEKVTVISTFDQSREIGIYIDRP